MTHNKVISVQIHAPDLAKLSDEAKEAMYAKARANRPAQPPPPEYATIPTKAMRLKQELTIWNKAGRPRASSELRKARLAACKNGCTYYNPKGNFMLGECTAPNCGCTRMKVWLPTAKCTHPEGSRWPDPATFGKNQMQPPKVG